MPAFPSLPPAGGIAAVLLLSAFAHHQLQALPRQRHRGPHGARACGQPQRPFRCLPQGLDARSLQVVADAPVRVGDICVQVPARALVAQSTGEDCSGVPLVLSTGQTLGQTQGSLPRPWTVDVQPEAAAPSPSPSAWPPRLRRWAAPQRWRRRWCPRSA